MKDETISMHANTNTRRKRTSFSWEERPIFSLALHEDAFSVLPIFLFSFLLLLAASSGEE
jgi:hypothetical protein